MAATTLKATGAFGFRDWQEAPYSEAAGGSKLDNVRVTNAYQGDLVGEGTAQYLTATVEGANGVYVGYEQVTGAINGRTGSFVLKHVGTFDGTSVTATLTVVAGSGSGELAGLGGTGTFSATYGAAQTPYTLDLTFG